MRRTDILENLCWAEYHFVALRTGRQVRRSQMLRLVELGLAESVGMCVRCDGDGFIQEPGREQEAFKITEPGRQYLRDRGIPGRYPMDEEFIDEE